MSERYDGKGGRYYTGNDRTTYANELRNRARNSMDTSRAYRDMGGYSGHADMAKHQAEKLNNAAFRVENGESVYDHETKEYDG